MFRQWLNVGSSPAWEVFLAMTTDSISMLWLTLLAQPIHIPILLWVGSPQRESPMGVCEVAHVFNNSLPLLHCISCPPPCYYVSTVFATIIPHFLKIIFFTLQLVFTFRTVLTSHEPHPLCFSRSREITCA